MKQSHEQRLAAIEEQAWRENMTEQKKNEIIFLEDMRFMDEQRILYRNGTLERINLEREIEKRDQLQRLERERQYLQQVEQVREQYLGMSNERQMQTALDGLDELHRKGLLSEREYQEALLAIRAQYADYETQSERDRRFKSILPTEKAAALQREMDELDESIYQELCRGLTPEETAVFRTVTDKMLDNFFRACGKKEGGGEPHA